MNQKRSVLISQSFGLDLLGILKIPGTQTDRGYKFDQRPAGHVGSLLIGMGFGAGWLVSMCRTNPIQYIDNSRSNYITI